MGRQNFLVKDFMPEPSSLVCNRPGLPAKLNPDRGLAIFFAPVRPVGSLAEPPLVPAAEVPAWECFLLAFPPVPGVATDFFLFFGVAVVPAEGTGGAVGAPESPAEGVEKKRSASAMLFTETLQWPGSIFWPSL